MEGRCGGGSIVIEPGDQEPDGFRQAIPALLGIDEVARQEALEAGKSFTFEIPSESARLIGGEAWNGIIRANQAFPGGLAEAFARDLRLAKVYAGLSEMGTETAAAMVAGVGLRTLVLQHADLLGSHSDASRLNNGVAAVPGGAPADPVWTKLAGTRSRDPREFFRALLQKDLGRLAEFYATLARSDAAHQRFFTQSPAAAARSYELLRDRTWPASSAPDQDVLLKLASPETLIALARFERDRGAPLDEASVRVLARHYAEWKSLFPYFERLPGLGSAEFEALETFSTAGRSYEPATRNLVLGEWHSLVELIALGARAGSLDAGASARMFRRVSEALQARDFSARAVEVLRAMAGQRGGLDEAVPATLLRLGGERRAAFERLRELQNVPRLDARLKAQDDAGVLHALSGLVYAAWLDPEGLLVSEDPSLVRKHRFVDLEHQAGVSPLFPPGELQLSSEPPGSCFSGGFATFGEAAQRLAHGGGSAGPAPAALVASRAPVAPTSGQARVLAAGEVFRADARLVEVPATVTDGRGRYIDSLSREEFMLLEEGRPQQLAAFESHSSSLTCALVLDATGSMQAALPALKNAALKLIGELRESDSVAVYSFNETVSVLQPFTTDKRAAKRAVLRAYPDGRTALYDALARVGRDIASRSGKKAIIVFTDGADNTSALTADTAIKRAKIVGAPVYAVAQGAAIKHLVLLKQLKSISVATGGLPYSIREPGEIRGVFESVANDLKHGYLLAYRPPPAKGREWRGIKVQLAGIKTYKVRAREGYYPE